MERLILMERKFKSYIFNKKKIYLKKKYQRQIIIDMHLILYINNFWCYVKNLNKTKKINRLPFLKTIHFSLLSLNGINSKKKINKI